MDTRRRFLSAIGALGVALAGCGDAVDGDNETAEPAAGEGSDIRTVTGTAGGTVAFSTPAFESGGTIPERFTGVGADVSPKLVVESVPDEAKSLALLVDDPDAPGYSGTGGFVHWLLWNVPGDVDHIPEGVSHESTVFQGARQGTNDFDEVGYRGPLPPESDGPHTYRFTMYAVENILNLEGGSRRDALETALDGHVLGTHQVTAQFER
jgi:Raf kinase inhibitor-like YbhB/YbcL family protein